MRGPLSRIETRALAQGFTPEFDTVSEDGWRDAMAGFEDANIYQTWPYADVVQGRRNVSRFVLKRGSDVAALAQVRIARIPLIGVGVAYVRWGPIWRPVGGPHDINVFRQAVRALRNEFVCRRGWVLRLLPELFGNEVDAFAEVLRDEGFSLAPRETPIRTILMDLSPSLDDLRAGMRSHWKRELKLAERHQLEVVEGTSDELFGEFIEIYRDMVARKKFVESNDINQFRQIQARLPEAQKMKIMLCRSEQGVCAGIVCSVIGNTAIYIFGATSSAGMKANGSYLLQWKFIQRLKSDGCQIYNLNGINPVTNPGTYKFKNDLAGANGRDVNLLGRFDSDVRAFSYPMIQFAERLKASYQKIKRSPKALLERSPAK